MKSASPVSWANTSTLRTNDDAGEYQSFNDMGLAPLIAAAAGASA